METKLLNDVLVEMFEHLQKVAVGFEQIIEDQKTDHGKFITEFSNMNNSLFQVIKQIRSSTKGERYNTFNQGLRILICAFLCFKIVNPRLSVLYNRSP